VRSNELLSGTDASYIFRTVDPVGLLAPIAPAVSVGVTVECAVARTGLRVHFPIIFTTSPREPSSLVAVVRDEEAVGSNPATPTHWLGRLGFELR
jgi:hypothetical protein